MNDVFDCRIECINPIISPQEMLETIHVSNEVYEFIAESRNEISRILNGKDNRFLIIVGPCSIHNTEAALEYAKKLSVLQKEYADKFYIVMRTYFEKPRTVSGWRGLIVEPDLDGVINITDGLKKARKFLISIASLKLPAAVEMLDPIIPQYLADLVSWASIGARSAESQTHRELASGLSMPVGFKNTTSGDVKAAINGIIVSRLPHAFVSISRNGFSSIIHTKGNADSHLILRGGNLQPNYDRASIVQAKELIDSENIKVNILIDCSHGNSQRRIEMQKEILLNTLALRFDKNFPFYFLRGCMLESFLLSGNCKIADCKLPQNYGKSITDPCMSWEQTEYTIKEAAKFCEKMY